MMFRFQPLGALVALAISLPVHANCWTPEAQSAARLRHLDTMMMVSALRCRNSGHDLMPVYARFVEQNRGVLLASSALLQQHFGSPAAYDRYVTKIANSYGAGVKGMNCEAVAATATIAAGNAGDLAGLESVADQAGISVTLDDKMCSDIAGR
jgi:predicted RNase H-like nuclease